MGVDIYGHEKPSRPATVAEDEDIRRLYQTAVSPVNSVNERVEALENIERRLKGVRTEIGLLMKENISSARPSGKESILRNREKKLDALYKEAAEEVPGYST